MSLADAILSAEKHNKPAPIRHEPTRARSIVTTGDRAARYIQTVLYGEADKVRNALIGTRNQTLNTAAFSCAQFAELDDTTIETELASAARECGLEGSEIAATIASGLRGGRAVPREIPEPTMPSRNIGAPPPEEWKPTTAPPANDAPPISGIKAEAQEHTLTTAASYVGSVVALVEARANGTERSVPVPFGQYSLAMGGGLWPGVHCVVGLTGGQKSQLVAQCVKFAAANEVPTLIVTLELTAQQSTLRLLCDFAGISWSKCESGKASATDIAKLKAAEAEFGKLPIAVEYARPQIFSVAELDVMVGKYRKQHPTGPLYTAVDFVQLVGSIAPGTEARERVGSVMYGAQEVAKKYDVAITAVSSTSRANYTLLSDVEHAAKLKVENGELIVGNPSAVLAAAKESGEAEYASESLLVLSRWPAKLENGDDLIIGVQGKYRFDRCHWFAMASHHGRLHEYNVDTMDDLPRVERERGGVAKVDTDEIVSRIVDYVSNKRVTSRRQARDNVTGNKTRIETTWDTLVSAGRLVKADDGAWKVAP